MKENSEPIGMVGMDINTLINDAEQGDAEVQYNVRVCAIVQGPVVLLY